jgi:hypothetical protein
MLDLRAKYCKYHNDKCFWLTVKMLELLLGATIFFAMFKDYIALKFENFTFGWLRNLHCGSRTWKVQHQWYQNQPIDMILS